MDVTISPTAEVFARVLLAASCCSWLWIAWKLARRQNPLPPEPRPNWEWSWESLPQIVGVDFDKVPSDCLLGLIAFVVAAFPVLELQELLTHWVKYEHPMIETLLANRNLETLLDVSARAVIMAPIVEELLFRRLIQGTLEWLELRIHWGVPRGIIPILISSSLFALAHLGQGAAPVPLFFLALILGYLHLQTHRIVPSILAHMCLNAFSLALVWTASVSPAVESSPEMKPNPPAFEAQMGDSGPLAPVKSASSAAVNFDSLIA